KEGEAAGGGSGSREVAGDLDITYRGRGASGRWLCRLPLAPRKSLRISQGRQRHLLVAFELFVGLLPTVGDHSGREPELHGQADVRGGRSSLDPLLEAMHGGGISIARLAGFIQAGFIQVPGHEPRLRSV